MARHIDAWMDHIRLADIGPITIKDVSEPGPEVEITYTERPIQGGQGFARRRRRSLGITIRAQIHELFDLKKRNAVRQALAGWCGGSLLELTNHPGQQLHVLCKKEPGLGDARDFNSVLDIELEAAEIPYWEDIAPVTASGSGASGSGTMWIPGTAGEVPVDVTVTPAAAITSCWVQVSGGGITKRITLSGISTAQPIVFGRDAHDLLTIRSGTTSMMRYRTQESADDLMIPAGNVTYSFGASGSCTAEFSARGRWL